MVQVLVPGDDPADAGSSLLAELPVPGSLRLGLLPIGVPFRAAVYRISQLVGTFQEGLTAGLSRQGVTLDLREEVQPGMLLRVFLELPEYWARRARRVTYRHTQAPKGFQVLARVAEVACGSAAGTRRAVCEIVNIDSVDGEILAEFTSERAQGEGG